MCFRFGSACILDHVCYIGGISSKFWSASIYSQIPKIWKFDFRPYLNNRNLKNELVNWGTWQDIALEIRWTTKYELCWLSMALLALVYLSSSPFPQWHPRRSLSKLNFTRVICVPPSCSLCLAILEPIPVWAGMTHTAVVLVRPQGRAETSNCRSVKTFNFPSISRSHAHPENQGLATLAMHHHASILGYFSLHPHWIC